MSEESQSLNFAKELLSQLKLALLALFLLLALSIVVNGVLFFQVLELKSDNSAVSETLKDTQTELLKQTSQEETKVVQRVLQSVYKLPKDLAARVAKAEVENSHKYGIPVSVGLAITLQESTFNPRAVSYNGSSYGLKQINCSAWCKRFGVRREDLFDIERNVEFGYRVLSLNLKQTGSMKSALAAYYGSTVQEQNSLYALSVLNKAKQFEV